MRFKASHDFFYKSGVESATRDHMHLYVYMYVCVYVLKYKIKLYYNKKIVRI